MLSVKQDSIHFDLGLDFALKELNVNNQDIVRHFLLFF